MTAPTQRARLLTSDIPARTIEVIRAASADDRREVLEIRRRVFAEEQHAGDLRVSDADDARSLIALALLWTPGAESAWWPVATGRLTPPLTYGSQALVAWVATVPEARGRGAGSAVMRFLLNAADNSGSREVALAAQIPAEAFYRRLGFAPDGPIYDARGIPHRKMIRRRRQ